MTARKRDKAKASEATRDVKGIGVQAFAGKALESQDVAENTPVSFPIVGIGASAGGLAAFEAFFSGMPAETDPGMAFVLVQHLAPDHKSILTELIRCYTRMQVFEVEDGMAVQPNCAYIIPPNRDMAFLNGTLQLLEPSAPRGQRLPIDFFFRSLARDQRERAICIVLSGTGSDGTLGVRAIKGEGGMVMAQNPESTEYDGMPLQRYCHRPGGLRTAAGRDARPAHGLCGPCLRQSPAGRIRPGAQCRERTEEDLYPAARTDRAMTFPSTSRIPFTGASNGAWPSTRSKQLTVTSSIYSRRRPRWRLSFATF